MPTGPQNLAERITLDWPEDWRSLERGRTREQFERDVLPKYLSVQRWFASKGTQIQRAVLKERFEFTALEGNWLLAVYSAHLADGRSEDYFLPLAIAWDRHSAAAASADSAQTLANIRNRNQTGVLMEALFDSRFISGLVRAVEESKTFSDSGGQWRFSHTSACQPLQAADARKIRKIGAEQSNSSILIADKLVLKAYRKIERGIHPELEIGRYLTEVAHYRNTPPLVGAIERLPPDGQPTALAVIQAFVPNQGDGWSFSLSHLKQLFGGVRQGKTDVSINHSYIALMERLGTRIGELQKAFAIETDDPGFRPRPITAEDVKSRKHEIQSEAETTFGLLATADRLLPPELKGRVQALLDQRRRVLNMISSFELRPGQTLMKTRFHGDLHLGQVLVSDDDFYIIDFEGEPARPFAQRRSMQSPLKDLAGMLRSLDYAAWSALFECAADGADEIASLEEAATDWVRASSAALMRGYKGAAEGCPSYPADPETFRQLLDLLLLEKALYEIRYELANRPSWLRIPVEGILNLLAHPQGY
ncbi:MAG TPA: putative maltokinase [Terriglobia bacterium]|jgi:maltose alpha-D-glucosyltransferase/alpha-amylase|nr:putative maltokinase [Terriglobia bacterium]